MFDAPSRAFLERDGLPGCDRALDLGCGPGFSTALLHDVLAPRAVLGIDASEAFVRAAQAREPRLAFAHHDVRERPLPGAPADLVYARFLVTHLADPAGALAGFARALRPGGRLLLDEVEWIRSASPVFARYLALVEEVLAERGQCLFVGPRLEALVRQQDLSLLASQVREHPVDPRQAARLFALNLATLRPEDRSLADALEALAADGGEPITWGLRQVVIGESA